jgi:hypothetical protein
MSASGGRDCPETVLHVELTWSTVDGMATA